MAERLQLLGPIDREHIEQRRLRLGLRHATYIYGKGTVV
jgi:hypothetical protein